METKICSNCKSEKTLNLFFKKKEGICGVDSRCKQCVLKLKHQYYLLKLKAKSGEISLIENESILIPEKAIRLFLTMQER